MPTRAFLVLLLSDDIEETARFLVDVVGLQDPRWLDAPGPQNARAFGWPEDSDTRRVVLGEGPGMVEVLEIPLSLRETVRPGLAFVGFATPDVEGYAARSAAAGFETAPVMTTVDGAGEPVSLAAVHVGGLPFELIRFGS